MVVVSRRRVRDVMRIAGVMAVLTFCLIDAGPARAQDADEIAELANRGAALFKVGKLSEARAMLRGAIALAENAYGRDDIKVGSLLDALAEVLAVPNGKLSEAVSLRERSLAIAEKAWGPDHPSVAQALDQLARLNQSWPDAGSEALFRRALAIREKALGPYHPAVAGSLNNLAALYQDQHRDVDDEPGERDSARRALGQNDLMWSQPARRQAGRGIDPGPRRHSV